eukprot:TRINITY_DN29818_c0_g1_i1.p1 TRINITY_DN29818_c0_g1~~TRINITY_DN29818_c0_g1_i1.p1  ORF type:complete len:373 (-),score=48.48 TRINITY_DN29818_c0_g1_i1:177-1247(-)
MVSNGAKKRDASPGATAKKSNDSGVNAASVTAVPEISTAKNIFNAVLCFGLCIPPYLIVRYLRDTCLPNDASTYCSIYLEQPVTSVNIGYFVMVDVLFWVIYLLQGSAWLIDPYWTLIPVMIALFYFTHPSSSMSHPRALFALALVVVWSARLTHNYFRREEWKFGAQEDWRYQDMRKKHGRWWWFTSFFAVSVAQHPMFVGMTLPLWPVMKAGAPPLGMLDLVAVTCCIAGITIGMFADNQLYDYMHLPPEKKPIVLKTGLWGWSRHPNHFGEQLWWVGLLLLGYAAAGPWWISAGVLFNHPLDILVTLGLNEERMLRKEARREAFKAYQRCTSFLIPLPPGILGKSERQEKKAT